MYLYDEPHVPFVLTSPEDEDLLVPVSIGKISCNALSIQLQRLGDEARIRAFGEKLGAAIEKALQECMDWDLRAPSKAQLDYAIAIAAALKVDLPGDVFYSRGAAQEFFDRHLAAFKALKG